jgi:hypothetical protein
MPDKTPAVDPFWSASLVMDQVPPLAVHLLPSTDVSSNESKKSNVDNPEEALATDGFP